MKFSEFGKKKIYRESAFVFFFPFILANCAAEALFPLYFDEVIFAFLLSLSVYMFMDFFIVFLDVLSDLKVRKQKVVEEKKGD